MINKIKKTKTLNNIFSLGIATLISAILAFIVGIATRNILGPEAYGYWLSISILFTFIPLFHFGTLNAMNREVPFYMARKNLRRVKEIQDLTLSFIFTLPTLLVGFLLIISIALQFSSIASEVKNGIFLTSIIALLILLSTYVEMYYKSCQNFKFASRLISIKSVAQSLLTIIFVYWLDYLGLFIGMGLALIIQIFVGKKSIEHFKFKIDFIEYLKLMKIGFPILLVGIVWGIMIVSDRLIISLLMTPKDLGNYGVGMLIFNSMMLFPQVIGQVYYPKIVELSSKGLYYEIKKSYWKLNKILASVMFIIVFVSALIFPLFVEIFLPDYTEGISAGQILIFGVYPLTLIGFAANYFNAVGSQKLYISIQLGTILINIILSLIFYIRVPSITSIALGTSIAFLIYFIIMNIFFLLKIKKEVKREIGEFNNG